MLQAGLGGWKSYEGGVKAWVQFYDQNGNEDDPIALSSEIVGPTREERNDETLIFTKKLIDETVPVGTKYAKVFLSFSKTTKELNILEGVARDINFKIAAYEIINDAPKADKDVNGGYLDIDSDGRNVTLNAIANEGFRLVKYYVNGVETDVNTFVAEGDSVEVDATFEILPLKFDVITMTLQNNLKMNFKVAKDLNLAYTDLQVEFIFNGASTVVTDYVEEEDYFVFEFANVGIQQMGDEITAILSGKVGSSTYSTTKLYSVKEYCYDLLERFPTATLVRTLAVDTLNLGAAAQVFYNYKTTSLVNANLTAEQKGWATPVREYSKEYGYSAVIDNPRTAVTALQLYAENNNAIDLQIGINFCGEGVTGYEEGDYIEIVMPGKSGINSWTIAVSDLVNTTVDYKPGAPALNFDAGYFKGLNATVLSENMYITVRDVSGNAVSNTVRYSIENYCANKCDASESIAPGLANFVKAVMSYGDSAKAYAQGK